MDVVSVALGRFVSECQESAHALCGSSMSCVAAAKAHEDALGREQDARRFDVGHVRLSCGAQLPDHQWSTTALMRSVNDLVLGPPFRQSLRRSFSITMALARLGERGVPPDALMRTCLGAPLTRQILVRAAAHWCAEKSGTHRRGDLPPDLVDWLEVLDADERIASINDPTVEQVASAAVSGSPAAVARDWIATASVADIISWRIKGYQPVVRTPDDLVLPAGRDATIWVFDRFTRTYADEWHEASPLWELVFNSQPALTAQRVGLPLPLLQERIVTDRMVVESLERRVAGLRREDIIHNGLQVHEVLSAVVAMLEASDVGAARVLAGRSCESAPWYTPFRVAYAFCTIPVQQSEARSALDSLRPGNSFEFCLRQINRATCSLFEGDKATAGSILEALDSEEGQEQEAWLWDPVAAFEGRAVIQYCMLKDWLRSAMPLVL